MTRLRGLVHILRNGNLGHFAPSPFSFPPLPPPPPLPAPHTFRLLLSVGISLYCIRSSVCIQQSFHTLLKLSDRRFPEQDHSMITNLHPSPYEIFNNLLNNNYKPVLQPKDEIEVAT